MLRTDVFWEEPEVAKFWNRRFGMFGALARIGQVEKSGPSKVVLVCKLQKRRGWRMLRVAPRAWKPTCRLRGRKEGLKGGYFMQEAFGRTVKERGKEVKK